MNDRTVLRFLVLFTIVTRLALAFRPETQLTQRLYQEDAFYTLNCAYHLAHGHGFSIDGIHPTNGVQPLLVVLDAACFAIAGEDKWLAIRLSFIWVALFESCCVLLIYKILTRGRDGQMPWYLNPGMIGAFLWTFVLSNLIYNAIGLETGMYAMMILWVLYRYAPMQANDRAGTPTGLFELIRFGSILGLLILCRIDGVFLAIALVSYPLLSNNEKRLNRTGVEIGIWIGTSVLVSAPWWVYNYTVFGSLMPISGQAESIGMSLTDNLISSITTIVNIILTIVYLYKETIPLPIILLFDGIVLWTFVRMLRRHRVLTYLRQQPEILILRPLFMACIIFVIYYTFFFNAHHFMSRYFQPLRVLAIVFWSLTIPYLIKERSLLKQRSAKVLAGLLIVSAVIFNGAHYIYNYTISIVNPLYVSGKWAQLHPDYKIGMTSSGIAEFIAGNVINLDGKVNYEALKARQSDSLGVYVVRNNISVLIDWPQNAEPIISQASKLGVTFKKVDSIEAAYIYQRDNL